MQGLNGSANYESGPYVKVYPGDGIKQVLGITLQAACGGVFAAVLCAELAMISNKDNTGRPYEVDYVAERLTLPVIPDGAYLNFLGRGTTAAAPGHIALLETVWS
jgi:hypothetical protein